MPSPELDIVQLIVPTLRLDKFDHSELLAHTARDLSELLAHMVTDHVDV